MKILLSCFFCTVFVSVTPHALSVRGYVGGEVRITCSHRNARENIKLFCNGSCRHKDILIRSDREHNPTVRGRFSLLDEGTGTFIVTVSRLKKSDTGTYWCGVERSWMDTYTEVMLTVSEAPAPTTQPATTTPEQSPQTEETTTSETSLATKQHTPAATTAGTPGSRETFIISIGAGLAALLVFFIILLLILVVLKRKRKKGSTQNFEAEANMNSQATSKPSSSNQKLKSKADQIPQSEHGSTVYAIDTSSPPEPQDALHYATVNFTATHPHPAAAASESLYSNVQTTPSSPSATEPNSVIYSTVKKVKKRWAV